MANVARFFFNDTATTEIYTLSLHDALPISGPPDPPAPVAGQAVRGRRPQAGRAAGPGGAARRADRPADCAGPRAQADAPDRSEEHTSELQSRQYLVCRLLLEKKKITKY